MNVTHTFEIRNNGPSNIRSLDVVVSVPLAFVNPWIIESQTIIDFSTVSIKAMYDNQMLQAEWTQDNIILLNAIETTTLKSNLIAEDGFDAQTGMEWMNQQMPDDLTSPPTARRRRRSIDDDDEFSEMRHFNLYTQRINDDSTSVSRQRRDIGNDQQLKNLPPNRTILFDCHSTEQRQCVQAKFVVNNFKVGNQPIFISLNFTIDLAQIGKS